MPAPRSVEKALPFRFRQAPERPRRESPPWPGAAGGAGRPGRGAPERAPVGRSEEGRGGAGPGGGEGSDRPASGFELSRSDSRSERSASEGTMLSSAPASKTPSSGAAKDASTAAADCACPSSIPAARSRSRFCGLMPPASVSRVMSREPSSQGTSLLSSNANAPSLRRASCSRANTIRERSICSCFSPGRSGRLGSRGGEAVVKAQTTRPSAKTMPPSPSSIRIER